MFSYVVEWNSAHLYLISMLSQANVEFGTFYTRKILARKSNERCDIKIDSDIRHLRGTVLVMYSGNLTASQRRCCSS
jgi:hypothetical protein